MPATWVETRDVPLLNLTRFPGNARRGNVPKIRESIRANGQYRSLVVRQCDDGTLVILAGNHTYDALRYEARKLARYEIITCTDHEARKINLADNRLSDLAMDDGDDLVILLSYLDGDYAGSGFTEDDVTRMIEPPMPAAGDGDGAPGESTTQATCPNCGHSFPL